MRTSATSQSETSVDRPVPPKLLIVTFAGSAVVPPPVVPLVSPLARKRAPASQFHVQLVPVVPVEDVSHPSW